MVATLESMPAHVLGSAQKRDLLQIVAVAEGIALEAFDICRKGYLLNIVAGW